MNGKASWASPRRAHKRVLRALLPGILIDTARRSFARTKDLRAMAVPKRRDDGLYDVVLHIQANRPCGFRSIVGRNLRLHDCGDLGSTSRDGVIEPSGRVRFTAVESSRYVVKIVETVQDRLTHRLLAEGFCRRWIDDLAQLIGRADDDTRKLLPILHRAICIHCHHSLNSRLSNEQQTLIESFQTVVLSTASDVLRHHKSASPSGRGPKGRAGYQRLAALFGSRRSSRLPATLDRRIGRLVLTREFRSDSRLVIANTFASNLWHASASPYGVLWREFLNANSESVKAIVSDYGHRSMETWCLNLSLLILKAGLEGESPGSAQSLVGHLQACAACKGLLRAVVETRPRRGG